MSCAIKNKAVKFYCILIVVLFLNFFGLSFAYAVFPEPKESIEERSENFEIWKSTLDLAGPSFLITEVRTVLYEVERLLKSEDVVIKIDDRRVEVVGDIHGNILALSTVLEYFFKNLSQDHNFAILFLGDYVDRGNDSIQSFLILAKLKIMFPNNVYLLRGNHETNYISKCNQVSNFTLTYECMMLGNQFKEIHSMFQRVFSNLSLAAVIDDCCVCVHGGIPDMAISEKENKDFIDFLSSLSKPIDPSKSYIVSQVLWNDPCDGNDDFTINLKRGGMYRYFGRKAIESFLNSKHSIILIRGHQCCNEGYKFSLAKKVLTVFSYPNYCGSPNLGAVAILDRDKKNEDFISFICFDKEGKTKGQEKQISIDDIEKDDSIDEFYEDFENCMSLNVDTNRTEKQNDFDFCEKDNIESTSCDESNNYMKMSECLQDTEFIFDEYSDKDFPLEEFIDRPTKVSAVSYSLMISDVN